MNVLRNWSTMCVMVKNWAHSECLLPLQPKCACQLQIAPILNDHPNVTTMRNPITGWLHFEYTQCWDHLALLVKHVDSIQNMLPEVSQMCSVITFWMLLHFLMCLTCVQNVPDLFIWVHWGHMTGYILKVLNIYPTTTLNSHLWVYFKCTQFFTTGHIIITLGQSFKMGVICNWWAYFGYSGSKHSEYTQFLTITHIVDPLQRTFKMYPIFNC